MWKAKVGICHLLLIQLFIGVERKGGKAHINMCIWGKKTQNFEVLGL